MWGLVRLGKAFTVVAVDKETQCGEAGDEELRARSDETGINLDQVLLTMIQV